MAVLKCKMCGGNLEVQEGMTVCECEYCGSKQTVPSVDDEKKNDQNKMNAAVMKMVTTPYNKQSIELSPITFSIKLVSGFNWEPVTFVPNVIKSTIVFPPTKIIYAIYATSTNKNNRPLIICLFTIFPKPKIKALSFTFMSPFLRAFITVISL